MMGFRQADREEKINVANYSHRQVLEAAVKAYLDECYAKRTVARVSELAERLHLSSSYLSRRSHVVLGTTVSAFLRQKQLEHAKHLLRSTDLTISGVATVSAFGTPSSFYRCFAIASGMTPAEYRRANVPRRAARRQQRTAGRVEVMKCE